MILLELRAHAKRRDLLLVFFVAAIICLCLFGELANEVGETETDDFDFWMHGIFQHPRWRILATAMRVVTLAAGPVCLALLLCVSAFVLWRQDRRWKLTTLVFDAIGGFAVITFAKYALYRMRPEAWQSAMGSSFPSGHTFDAVTIYGLLGYWLAAARPAWRTTIVTGFLGFAVLIGCSRVIVGVHYPADILGGLLLGVAWLFVCVALSRTHLENDSRPADSERLNTGKFCPKGGRKTLTTYKQPGWYSNEDDSAWERVKLAFKNDWEQTKHDFGSETARDLDQNVDDTVKQMAGKQDPRQPAMNNFDAVEPAYKYGYAAKRQYANIPENELDTRFREDWTSMGRDDYDAYRDEIRRGYNYSGL